MHAHGKLIGSLEREVESRRAHDKDTQLTLAKLTTEHVRLDAEHQTLRCKLALEREQHESARCVIVRVSACSSHPRVNGEVRRLWGGVDFLTIDFVKLREELQQSKELKDRELRVLVERIEQKQRMEGEQLVQVDYYCTIAHGRASSPSDH